MTKRPVFLSKPYSSELVEERFFEFQWHPGFAAVQKEKNIKALHAAAARTGLTPLLEISTRSENKLGRHMSAFHMTVPTKEHGRIKLELAFQGSKVFGDRGPFTDLYKKGDKEIGQAKRDPRLQESGELTGFRFEGFNFPNEPKTVFYDWLYCRSILEKYSDWVPELDSYAGFTDIEFNPRRSINCQARSAALFLSLKKRGVLDAAMNSPTSFRKVLSKSEYRPGLFRDHRFKQRSLFESN